LSQKVGVCQCFVLFFFFVWFARSSNSMFRIIFACVFAFFSFPDVVWVRDTGGEWKECRSLTGEWETTVVGGGRYD
jgi:hypothetical protein